jgi:hypothetical protein
LKIFNKYGKPLILTLCPAVIPLTVDLIIGRPTITKYALVEKSPAYFTNVIPSFTDGENSDFFLLINSDAVHGGEEKGVLMPWFNDETADWSFAGVGIPASDSTSGVSSVESKLNMTSSNVGITGPLPGEVDERNRRIALHAAIQNLGLTPLFPLPPIAHEAVRDRIRRAESELRDPQNPQRIETTYMLHHIDLPELNSELRNAHELNTKDQLAIIEAVCHTDKYSDFKNPTVITDHGSRDVTASSRITGSR